MNYLLICNSSKAGSFIFHCTIQFEGLLVVLCPTSGSFHLAFAISASLSKNGAPKPSGPYTELKMDNIPLTVVGLALMETLNPNK